MPSKIDWLRDIGELEEYAKACEEIRLSTQTIVHIAVVRKSDNGFPFIVWSCCDGNGIHYDCNNHDEFNWRNFALWFPWNVDHYNAWKAEREARPRCKLCGKYAEGFPQGWVGGVKAPWICPECQKKPCCATCGTACDTSHYAYANCGVMVGEYRMWTPQQPAEGE